MTPFYKPRPERWPQFSLRGLFVLVTVLGGFLGWVVAQVKWVGDRHEALNGMRHHSYQRAWTRSGITRSGMAVAPWPIRLIERGVAEIIIDDPLVAQNASKVAQLKRLFPEARILTCADPRPTYTSQAVVTLADFTLYKEL